MMTRDLEGKVAFVSGASRGIGAALATRFAERGLRLVLCSRSEPVLPESERVLTRRLDVRDEVAVEALTRAAEERFGSIDLWVNNAGVLEPIKPIREVTTEEFQSHIETNLVGVFIGSKCYVRHLRRHLDRAGGSDGSVPPAKQGGVLINVSSGAAWKPYAGWGTYCAGKAGVERLTEVLQVEEAAIGLRAYSVAPGVVDTAMQTKIRASSREVFPDLDRFVQMKHDGNFNDGQFVADEFLAYAFDPDRRPSTVAHRVAYEEVPKRS